MSVVTAPKTRVLIVDDSAVVRKILSDAAAADAGIEVVGTAPDPIVARSKIAALRPDVITLDIEMPRMDGLTFLRELMKTNPLRVIVISSLAQKGCAIAMEAMEAGAVDVLAKPNGPYSVGDLRLVLAQKIRAAAQARLGRVAAAPVVPLDIPKQCDTSALFVIGASTGGTEAVRLVLQSMPAACPPILIVQHIPAHFSKVFADRLNQLCAMEVREAVDGDIVRPGLALVAPGDLHMILRSGPGGLAVQVKGGPRVCYQRPSVDVMFQSVAAAGAGAVARRTVAAILTGMGNDGAAGLMMLRKAGARTFGQDERTCVVYGMPREAFQLGAVEHQLPLTRVGPAMIQALDRGRKPGAVGVARGMATV